MSGSQAPRQSTRRGRSFASLGPLEVEVLALVWEGGRKGITVRDLYEQLRAERKIAYTTVLTELATLTRKGLLDRDSSGIAYRYRPAIPPRQARNALLDEIMRVFYRGQTGPAAAHLLGLASLNATQLEKLRDEAQRLQG
jgi:predicted transcriptional regulator